MSLNVDRSILSRVADCAFLAAENARSDRHCDAGIARILGAASHTIETVPSAESISKHTQMGHQIVAVPCLAD
jgi:hypothetical protein